MKFLKYMALTLGIAAFLGISVYEVRQVWAGCAINWDGSQPTCLTTDEFGDIDATEIDTSFGSFQAIPWTLVQSTTPGNNENLDTAGPSTSSPETTTIDENIVGCEQGDDLGCGGVVPVTITCSLSNTSLDGLYQLSAFSTDPLCSGSHDVVIKKPSTSCP